MEIKYKEIPIQEYDYTLDDERIAKHPLVKRDQSKLLIYKEKNITTSIFGSIVNHIKPDDLLVFNNTKVVQARLNFSKSSGASIEVFLLNPINPSDYQLAFGETHNTIWNCIVGNIKRWKGEILETKVPELDVTLKAEMIERSSDGALIKFYWDNSNLNFARIIETIGKVPIPPYLNRDAVDDDKHRYQTVYAKPEGSVAAPTAGLHFTSEIIDTLTSNGVNTGEVTLHVGAGTFKPVKCDLIGDHEMHTERIHVSESFIENILASKGNIIAVGTTSMRTLESLYWLGVKCIETKDATVELVVNQWDGYSLTDHYSLNESLKALLHYIKHTGKNYISASTRMIIVPGYRFKVVDILVTNFHQPRSTLLLLIAAFVDNDWKSIYNYALNNDYRFLSYGDSSLLYRKL